MQGLWSNHRRSKVNLNSPIPPATPVTPLDEPPLPSESQAETSNEIASVQTTSALDEMKNDPAESRPPTSTTKRKSRTTRASGQEESNKRMKTSGATNGTPSKDYTPPTTRLSDLGGVEACVEKMLELIAMPLCHPEIYLHTGIQPPRGVLLHGPPGCGKTLLANAMAGVSDFEHRLTNWPLNFPFSSRNLVYHSSASLLHPSFLVCRGNLKRLYVIFLMTRRSVSIKFVMHILIVI